jgi:hypothetical protein
MHTVAAGSTHGFGHPAHARVDYPPFSLGE